MNVLIITILLLLFQKQLVDLTFKIQDCLDKEQRIIKLIHKLKPAERVSFLESTIKVSLEDYFPKIDPLIKWKGSFKVLKQEISSFLSPAAGWSSDDERFYSELALLAEDEQINLMYLVNISDKFYMNRTCGTLELFSKHIISVAEDLSLKEKEINRQLAWLKKHT